jgi:hypothetical protein
MGFSTDTSVPPPALTNNANTLMKKNIAGKTVWIPLDKLKLHDMHSRFPELPQAKREQLKASMKKRGQKDPIEVIWDGKHYIVIDGRHRIKTAGELEWEGVWALVREDIQPSDEAAIVQALLEANSTRRQQGLLEQVEVVILQQPEATDAEVADLVDASKKQVGNLRVIIEGPAELLMAVKRKAESGVSEAIARKILALPRVRRSKCLALITTGGHVGRQLRSLLEADSPRAKQTSDRTPIQDLRELVDELKAGEPPTIEQWMELRSVTVSLSDWVGVNRPKLKPATKPRG